MLQVKTHLFETPADMYEFIKKNASTETKYLIENHLSAKRHLNDIILLANDAPIQTDQEIADYLKASINCYPKHASEDFILTPEAIQEKLDGKRNASTPRKSSTVKNAPKTSTFSLSSLIVPVTSENDEELKKMVNQYKELRDKQDELTDDENCDYTELGKVTKELKELRKAINDYKESHFDYGKLDEYITNEKATVDALLLQEDDIKDKREKLGIRLGRVHASLLEAQKNLKDAVTYRKMKTAKSSENTK